MVVIFSFASIGLSFFTRADRRLAHERNRDTIHAEQYRNLYIAIRFLIIACALFYRARGFPFFRRRVAGLRRVRRGTFMTSHVGLTNGVIASCRGRGCQSVIGDRLFAWMVARAFALY